MERGMRATRKHVSMAAPPRLRRRRSTSLPCGAERSSPRALRERHRENAPLVDPLLDLLEAGVLDELVELGLAAPAHNPLSAAPVARERACDQLELRVPRLAGVDEIPARLHRARKSAQGPRNRGVIRKELIKPRYDGNRRPR